MKYIIRCYLDNMVLLSHYDNFSFDPINMANSFFVMGWIKRMYNRQIAIRQMSSKIGHDEKVAY